MFDWFKSLFGKGKVRVEFTTHEGQKGSFKIDYIGDLNTLNEDELRENCRRHLMVEHRQNLKTFRIVGLTRG